MRRSPLGGGHDAAPAERTSAKAILVRPGGHGPHRPFCTTATGGQVFPGDLCGRSPWGASVGAVVLAVSNSLVLPSFVEVSARGACAREAALVREVRNCSRGRTCPRGPQLLARPHLS